MTENESKIVKPKRSIKLEELCEEYEIPKTIFYHSTQSQILQLIKNQKLHYNFIKKSESKVKKLNIDKL